jgi:hypothetical protein
VETNNQGGAKKGQRMQTECKMMEHMQENVSNIVISLLDKNDGGCSYEKAASFS